MAAFRRDVDILRQSGFDGFASLDYFGPHRRQLELLAKELPPAGYSQMFVVPGYFTETDYPRLKEQILVAARSPYTTRLGGKLVFWCYLEFHQAQCLSRACCGLCASRTLCRSEWKRASSAKNNPLHFYLR